jgi:hypothetical protein
MIDVFTYITKGISPSACRLWVVTLREQQQQQRQAAVT